MEEDFGAVCTGCMEYVNQMKTRYKEEIKALRDDLQRANEALDASNSEIDRLRSKQNELEADTFNQGYEQVQIKSEVNDDDSLSMRGEDAVEETNTEIEYPIDICYIKTEPQMDVADIKLENESPAEDQQIRTENMEPDAAHVPRTFECVVCKRPYETVVQLQCHLHYLSMDWHITNPNSNSASIDGYKILCHEPGCGIAFQMEFQLTKHMRMHIKQPYSCLNCEKMFPEYDMVVRSHEKNCVRSDQKQRENSVKELSTHDSLRTNNSTSRSSSKGDDSAEPSCDIKTELDEDIFVVELIDSEGEAEQICSESDTMGSVDTEISTPFECMVCGQSCETVDQLQCHLSYYSVKWYFLNPFSNNPIFADGHTIFCHEPGCAATFQTQTELKQHMWMHMKQPYTCPNCERVFPQYDMDACRHGESCATSDQKQKRNSVDAIFNALLTHGGLKSTVNPAQMEMESVLARAKTCEKRNKRIRKFKCEVPRCPKMYVRKHGLKRHIIQAHPRFIPLSCDDPDCMKNFLTQRCLQNHITKTGHCQPIVNCNCCDQTSKTEKCLRIHVNKTIACRKDTFKCSICERIFVNKDYLRKHYLEHAEENPFECSGLERTADWRPRKLVRPVSSHSPISSALADGAVSERSADWFVRKVVRPVSPSHSSVSALAVEGFSKHPNKRLISSPTWE